MALRLTVTSEQGPELGDRASVLIGPEGGRIGRAQDNEWVLPDPKRFLSSHHAHVRFRNGSFLIEDTSTNGLFLNDGTDPVGRLGPQPLRPGDTLRLGAYQIKVSDDATPSVDASSVFAFSTADADAAGTQHDIGVELNISELLVNDADLSSQRRAFDPWGQPVEDSALLQFDHAQQSAARAMRPAPPRTPPPRAPAHSKPGSGTVNGGAGGKGLDAFSQGAGMNPRQLPLDGHDRLLRLAGLLLREALVGIKNLARTQRDIRQNSGLCSTADDPERIALQNLPVEDLVARLLLGHENQQLDAVQWLRELFGLATRHDAALMRALRPALEEFTKRLDPAVLTPGPASAERFRSITESPKGQLPHLFAEALARSFNDEIVRGPDED
ncbi:MAG: type VI secretion system-associated FHA domain protein TagH [Steroidobacteraceae bacterium]